MYNKRTSTFAVSVAAAAGAAAATTVAADNLHGLHNSDLEKGSKGTVETGFACADLSSMFSYSVS